MSEKLKVQSYKDLLVWQKGMDLTKNIYRITTSFPEEEKFGLIMQMRRASVPIPSNIAEGQARKSTKEFMQFISHANGSLAELDTQLILSMELGFCKEENLSDTIGLIIELIIELKKMLHVLQRNLNVS